MVPIEKSELRRRRQILGETQAQFADRCAVSAGYISQLESGVRERVSPPVFARICDALKVEDRAELMAP